MEPRIIAISRLLCLAVGCLGWPALAVAEEPSTEIRVPITEDGQAARREALGAALAKDLTRLTGQPGIGQQNSVKPLLSEPQRYVQQYRYIGDEDAAQRKLAVTFDNAALRDALSERGLAYWQPDRPPILLWLALEDQSSRGLVGNDAATAVTKPLRDALQRYGLALTLPLMDLEDRRQVGFSKVVNGADDTVLAASDRYGTPLVAMAVLRADGGRWAGRYRLFDGDQELASGRLSGDTRGQVARSLARALTGGLKPRYQRLPGGGTGGELVIWLRGVSALDDLTRGQRILAGLAGINAASVVGVRGDAVRFRLTTSAPQARVQSALEHSNALVSDPGGGLPAPRALPGDADAEEAQTATPAPPEARDKARSNGVSTQGVDDPMLRGDTIAPARAEAAAAPDEAPVFRLRGNRG